MRRLSGLLLGALLAGCIGQETHRNPKVAVFIGIDVSGSFRRPDLYDDSLEFLSHYIYGHLNSLGGLHPMKSLFVGAIGGKFEDEPQAFHPIQDFEGKTPEQIEADLKTWFSKKDHISDFNVFFRQVAQIAQKRNLSLSPITVVMLTDGIPAMPGDGGEAKIGRYEDISLTPLEFLSRKVTVRLLYADPTRSNKWETAIARQRVRIWTVDQQVMAGWKHQFVKEAPAQAQEKLWKWIDDNVDYRVRPVKLRLKNRNE